MNKLATLLLAGAVIAFASCGNNENNTSKEQVDSMVTARTDTMAAKMKTQNDSLINAMAKMRADSAMRADSMAKAAASKTSSKTTTKTTTHTTTTHTTTTSPGTKVTDRPGATDAHINGQTEKPKSVSDRPGAIQVK
jgi:hypothetical protein